MRVLVGGGRGFVGSRVVEALARLPDTQVLTGSRRPASTASVKLDLNDPEPFSTMESFDYIVNCSDSIKAPPDMAIDYCLDKGQTFLEASADLVTIDRILGNKRGPDSKAKVDTRRLHVYTASTPQNETGKGHSKGEGVGQ